MSYHSPSDANPAPLRPTIYESDYEEEEAEEKVLRTIPINISICSDNAYRYEFFDIPPSPLLELRASPLLDQIINTRIAHLCAQPLLLRLVEEIADVQFHMPVIHSHSVNACKNYIFIRKIRILRLPDTESCPAGESCVAGMKALLQRICYLKASSSSSSSLNAPSLPLLPSLTSLSSVSSLPSLQYYTSMVENLAKAHNAPHCPHQNVVNSIESTHDAPWCDAFTVPSTPVYSFTNSFAKKALRQAKRVDRNKFYSFFPHHRPLNNNGEKMSYAEFALLHMQIARFLCIVQFRCEEERLQYYASMKTLAKVHNSQSSSSK